MKWVLVFCVESYGIWEEIQRKPFEVVFMGFIQISKVKQKMSLWTCVGTKWVFTHKIGTI